MNARMAIFSHRVPSSRHTAHASAALNPETAPLPRSTWRIDTRDLLYPAPNLVPQSVLYTAKGTVSVIPDREPGLLVDTRV
jgi:hypothetical protein